MGFYENLKKLYKDARSAIQGKDTAGRIVYLMKQCSFFIMLISYLIDECGFRKMISYDNEIKIPQLLYNFVAVNISKLFIVYFIYYIVIKPVISKIVKEIKVRCEVDMYPLWYTIEDLFEVFFYSSILLIVLQDLLLCINGNEIIWKNNTIVYAFIIIGFMFRTISKLYLQNKKNWYYITMNYTDYFDSNGKRIAQNDKVVYKNKIYKLDKVNGIWYLKDNYTKTDIKLEDAVADKEDNIKIHYYSMGRREEKE